MKKLLLPVFAVLTLAAGGYAWYLQSPLYALSEMGQAMAVHDRERFERHVDVDALVGNAVSDYAETQSGVKKAAVRTARFPVGVWLKMQLRRMVTKAPEAPPPEFAYLRWFWQTGNEAHVQMVLRDKAANRDIPVALQLVKDGGAWRVVRLVNLAELLESAQGSE